MAEKWTGTKWAVQATPNPSGSTGTALSEVSCTSAHACEAVGSYTNSSGVMVTLAEVWNGRKWKLQATPNPAGSTATGLTGVSCISVHACEAVGFSTTSSGGHKTLAVVWNGRKWAVQVTPDRPASITNVLGAVSCTGANACKAVGYYAESAALFKTLAEAWNGKKWTVQASPNPSGSVASSLFAVSCGSGHACEAVGHYLTSSASLAFAERWNGTKWAVQTTPSPVGTGFSLSGVSCASSAACEAVGNRNSSGLVPLADRWNGTKWANQTTPSPSGSGSSLSDVSCVSADSCEAVGIDSSRSGTLAERWNGTKWAIQKTPTP